MIVISTGNGTAKDWRAKCERSVATQVGVGEVRHLIYDAAEDDGSTKAHFEVMSTFLRHVPADEIVVSLDLDDWLATPHALRIVQNAHDACAWATYGSFRYADGRPGFAAPCPAHACRVAPWTMSHLKTFRAGLFHRIKPEHLKTKPDGPWLPHARDLALMFPIAEMSGDRCMFLPDVLAIYNYGASGEFNGDAEYRQLERAYVASVRSLPPYERIDAL